MAKSLETRLKEYGHNGGSTNDTSLNARLSQAAYHSGITASMQKADAKRAKQQQAQADFQALTGTNNKNNAPPKAPAGPKENLLQRILPGKPSVPAKQPPKTQPPATFKPPTTTVGDLTSGKAKQQQAAQKPGKFTPNKVEKAAAGVGNFLTSSEQVMGKAIGRALPGGTNDVKAQNQAAASQAESLANAKSLYKSGKITKPAYQKLLALNTAEADKNVATATKSTKAIKDEGDPGHIIANSAGVGLDVLSGGLDDAGKLALKTADKYAGKKVVQTVAKTVGDRAAGKIGQVADRGIVGTVDNAVSRAGKKVVYKAADLLGYSNPVGRKVIGAKDKFMEHWTTALHPAYKAAKRSDFEGRTTDAFATLRSAFGDSNRALSNAQHYMETNKPIKDLTDSLHARGLSPVKTRKQFDEYAAAHSDRDLLDAGKKQGFSQEKIDQIDKTLAKHKDKGFDKEYKSLVEAYSDINKLLHKEGIRSTEVYKHFRDDPFDYVRQQREIPDWMKEMPGAGGRKGSVASITESQLEKRRNKFASGEVLSPYETLIKTVQNAHVEIGRNRAAKTLYKVLEQAGEGKLMRSTDVVREKQALLGKLKESKPIVSKLNRTLRVNQRQARRLATQLNQLNKKGLDISLKKEAPKASRTPGQYLTKEEVRNPRTVKGKTTQPLLRQDALTGTTTNRLTTGKQLSPNEVRQMMTDLVTKDPAELAKVKRMIVGRDAKLEPLMDTIDTLNRDLADLHAHRSDVWNAANSLHSTVDKKGLTSISFLDDGVENIVKVDPAIASAVHNWDAQSQNVMNEFLRRFNQVFKYGTTGMNAGFALPNFVADQAESLINSPAAFATHNPYIFTKTLFNNLGLPMTKKDEHILQIYTEENGKSLAVNMYTKPSRTARVANDLVLGKHDPKALSNILHEAPDFMKGVDRASKKAYTYINPLHAKDSYHALFQGTEGLIGLTEQQTRLQVFSGLYRKAIRQGKTEEEARKIASRNSREASIDFLEMGNYGRVVNSFIPYFNAALQGGRTVGRNFAERPVSVAAKTAAVMGMPVAATTIWNTTDPKRRAIYNTIPDYVKETNFVVVSPGASWDADKKKWNGVFLLKKPQGYRQFGEPLRKFIEYKANNGDGATLAKFLKDQGASSAFQVAGSMSPISTNSPTQALGSVIPQASKGAIEGVSNYNFFEGRPIVAGKLQNLPPEDQKYDHSSHVSNVVASKLGISPLKVDNFIRETFGEAGTNIQNKADRLTTKDQKQIGGRTLPDSVSRRFVGASGGADADAFYSRYKPVKAQHDKVSKQVTDLVNRGQNARAARLINDYNNGLSGRFQSFYERYHDSPTYDHDPKTGWNAQISKLMINPKRAAN